MRSTAPRLSLVRHGQDQDNSRSLINGRRDTPLTDLGRAQAQAVANDLRSKEIDCIYTSPLQRAKQTASIICEAVGCKELRIEAGLIERDYGALTGRPLSDITAIATEVVVFHGFRYVIDAPGIEGYPHLWARAAVVLRKLQEQHDVHNVLIVAHNEIIKMIRANFEGRSWEDELRLPPLINCQVIALGE